MGTELVHRTNLPVHGGAMGAGDNQLISTPDRTVAASVAASVTEARAAIMLAKEFPRNEMDVFQQVIAACKRPSFAEKASYAFPRGGSLVTGPSVHLAREMARAWGNIQHGHEVIVDNEESRKIRAWAWDVQTNTRVIKEDEFKKLIQRKNKQTGQTNWVTPDERDLRELTNRRAAILLRNAILELMPPDFIEDARARAADTLESRAKEDPEGEKKKIAAVFLGLGIPASELEEWGKCKMAQFTPKMLAELRQIYASVRDGNSRWAEHLGRDTVPPKKTQSLDDLKGKGKGGKGESKPQEGELASPEQLERIQEARNSRRMEPGMVDKICRNIAGVGLAELPASKVDGVISEIMSIE